MLQHIAAAATVASYHPCEICGEPAPPDAYCVACTRTANWRLRVCDCGGIVTGEIKRPTLEYWGGVICGWCDYHDLLGLDGGWWDYHHSIDFGLDFEDEALKYIPVALIDGDYTQEEEFDILADWIDAVAEAAGNDTRGWYA